MEIRVHLREMGSERDMGGKVEVRQEGGCHGCLHSAAPSLRHMHTSACMNTGGG